MLYFYLNLILVLLQFQYIPSFLLLYIIFALVIVIFAYRALKNFKKGDTTNVLKNLAVIPIYLVVLFVVMAGFDLIFVKSNELDKEKKYIAEIAYSN